MILDKKLMFSEDQSVAGTASATVTSSNVISVQDAGVGEGNPKELSIGVTTAVSGTITTTATSTLQIQLITSDYEGLTGSTVLLDTGALAYTNWDAVGDGPSWRVLPNNCKKFLGILYKIGAGWVVSAGNINAGIVANAPTNP